MNLYRFFIFPIILVLPFLVQSQASQNFTGGATGPIPDDQTWKTFALNIPSLNASPINTNWGLEKVTLNITHTWDADLEVRLQSPDGTEVLLFSGVGGDGDNFTNTGLKNTYPTSITLGTAPFNGSYRPMGDLGLFNNGQAGTGIWYLKIRDGYPQDQGNVNSWSIRFGDEPAIPFPPVSTNLPIIKINTNGQAIGDDPKIAADFMVVDNGAGQLNHSNDTQYAYHGIIGIEFRGSSSGGAPKKSYGFETWDSAYNSIDTSILGMPAESDWILSASYYDKTLMRNVLSYYLANQTGHYASRTRYCELFVNGVYSGVYILMEKIKRNEERVDIAKLNPEDTTGDQLTGGYIVKIDKFTGSGGDGFYSDYPPSNSPTESIFFQYEYPKQEEIQQPQKDYINRYIDSFEHALFGADFQDPEIGFRQFVSEKSLIDYLFLNEMSKNVDGYRLSTYLYKDKYSKGGKLRVGPAWDYDIAWMNADYCDAPVATGWAYNVGYVCAGAGMPAWWERLRQDSLFNQHLYCRWNYLRSNVLSFDSVLGYIDSTAAYLEEGQQRNFETWPILGQPTWPEPTPLPQTYAEEIARLKDWVNVRFTWLDQQFNALAHNPVPVTLGNDTTFCSGSELRLYPGDFDSYLWNTGDNGGVVYAGTTGTYTVTISDNFQCSGSDAVHVEVLPSPVVNLGNDTAYCQGGALQLASGSAQSYVWNTGDTTSTITVSAVGTYSVTATGSNQCTATDAANVYEFSPPDASVQVVYSIDAAYQFETVDSAGKTSIWYFGNGDSSIINNPFYNYEFDWGYKLVTHIVIDVNGCTATDTLTIFVYPMGISDINNADLSIYPNPATSTLYITSTPPIKQLRVLDIVGNNCAIQTNRNSSNTAIDISGLAAGVYLLEIQTTEKTQQRRFIKQ
ncbi:MAG TPA: CotH kinase family protein [Chitinophagales bacterium]|nr:CotH kinase family protein [Chitinophagales bacterium]